MSFHTSVCYQETIDIISQNEYLYSKFLYQIENPTFNDPILYPKGVSEVYTTQVNNIAFAFPPVPLLTQYKDIPQVRINTPFT